ncbi:hypothetical protein EON65_53005 [archaeon]|nr:MAG: hypothetical protein EON65_53005 [archaeon]
MSWDQWKFNLPGHLSSDATDESIELGATDPLAAAEFAVMEVDIPSAGLAELDKDLTILVLPTLDCDISRRSMISIRFPSKVTISKPQNHSNKYRIANASVITQ